MDTSRDVCLIPGYEHFTNYDIDITGKLRNCKTFRHIEGYLTKEGYTRFGLNQEGVRKVLYLHVAMRELFGSKGD
jgi:hypothetical protein